uniref:eCIS core domain-containing protein n=1 Tax=Streptomyces lushanensis TaxID=1434255 RepID=UPI000B1198BA
MRDHIHDRDHENGDATASRPHQADEARLFEAAAGGRADVVGPSGMGVLQRVVGNSAVGAMMQRKRDEEAAPEERSPVHDVVGSGSGQALDTDTRADMEARLGSDFSDVRVHTGDTAHLSAKSVGAHAYTVGNNVVFQRDAYDPSSHSGRTTLAHELTHVIQQRSGPVDGTDAPGG